MNNLTLCIIVGLSIIAIEVPIDHCIWRRKRAGKKKFIKEKPFTTIMRLVLIVGAGLLIPGNKFMNMLLIGVVFWTPFDQIINVSRWKKLKAPYSPSINSFMRIDIIAKYGYNQTWDFIQGKIKEYYMNDLNHYIGKLDFWQRVGYRLNLFIARSFYHAEPQKRSGNWIKWFVSNAYKLFWAWIPWFQAELLIKAIILYIVIYFY